jgi:hypothetical protein
MVIEPLNGKGISNLKLNLSPDSYNSLVNIYSVFNPEATKAEVLRQY